MHWSKISLATLRALSLVGVVGILLVSGNAAFANNGKGHDNAHSKMSNKRMGHPIIIKKKHEHHDHKHRYPYPSPIRGPLPPVKKPPPSMTGGMPAPGGAMPAPTKPPAPPAPKPPAPAPAPGGAMPAPAPAPAPGPTPGGGRDPSRPPTRAQ
jgi:hypothetical protein